MELNVDSEAEMEKAGPDHDYWVTPKAAAMAKEMANLKQSLTNTR